MSNNKKLIIGCDASGSGGVNATPLLTGYHIQYAKLWSDDTGRNMNGDNSGSLVGVFTKLVMDFGVIKMTEAKARQLIAQLNKTSAYVKYYDPATGTDRIEEFYFGDIEIDMLPGSDDNIQFSEVSIIANHKRGTYA